MPRGRQSVDQGLWEVLDATSLFWQAVTDPHRTADVELFLKHPQNTARVNAWSEHDVLPHFQGCFEGKARAYSNRESVGEIFDELITRFGVSTGKGPPVEPEERS